MPEYLRSEFKPLQVVLCFTDSGVPPPTVIKVMGSVHKSACLDRDMNDGLKTANGRTLLVTLTEPRAFYINYSNLVTSVSQGP